MFLDTSIRSTEKAACFLEHPNKMSTAGLCIISAQLHGLPMPPIGLMATVHNNLSGGMVVCVCEVGGGVGGGQ